MINFSNFKSKESINNVNYELSLEYTYSNSYDLKLKATMDKMPVWFTVIPYDEYKDLDENEFTEKVWNPNRTKFIQWAVTQWWNKNKPNSVEDDIAEIKKTLKEMTKSVNTLKKIMKDDYFNEAIIDFYRKEDEEMEKKLERLRQLDDLMNFYEEQKRSWGKKNENIQKYCDRTLAKLHDEYIELTIEVNTEEE